MSAGERRRAGWILALTVSLFAAPILVDLLVEPRRAFVYLAMDAFYYLRVARNHHHLGIFSYDGERLTNGYHPLWQWLLSPIYGGLEAIGEPWLLPALVLVGAAMIAGALVLLGAAWLRLEGRLSPLFPLVVPGVAALLATPLYEPASDRPEFATPETARTVYTTLWSYANGMESPLVLLLFGAGVWLYARSSGPGLGLAGVGLALTLARLDHGLFAFALVGAAWWTARKERGALRRAGYGAAVVAGGIAAYCAYNQIVYGSALPVSGSLKLEGGLEAARQNLREIAANFIGDPSRTVWLPSRARVAQLLGPMVVALVYLAATLRRSRRSEPGRLDALLVWMCAATFGLALYDLLAVGFGGQGSWYFPASSLVASLATLRLAERSAAVDRLARARGPWLAAWLFGCALAVTAYFVRAQHHPLHKADAAAFYYDEAPRIRAFYGDRPPRLVEHDDGIVGFATGFQTMSGTGFTLDAAAVAAFRGGGLGRLALERGFDRVASFSYRQFRPGPIKPAALRRAFAFVAREGEGIEVEVEYRSEDGRFVIARMSRR